MRGWAILVEKLKEMGVEDVHAEKQRQTTNVEGGARKRGMRENLSSEVGESLFRTNLSYVEATKGGRRKTEDAI